MYKEQSNYITAYFFLIRCDIEYLDIIGENSKQQILDKINGKDAILCTTSNTVDQEVLEKAGMCKCKVNVKQVEVSVFLQVKNSE